MANQADHCASLVREADRDRYLATLFAPADRRAALFALYAFAIEIGRVRDVAREPMPGEIRLQWWREVLEGKRDGEAAAHPVASALMAGLKRHSIKPDRLVGIVDAHGFDLYDEPMGTLDDLDNYGVMTQSALLDVAIDILGGGGPEAMMVIRGAGIALTVTDSLVHLAKHVSRRQMFVPIEVLDRHGVNIDEVYAGKTSEALKNALAEMRRHARRQMIAARNDGAQVPLAILPALLPLALIGPTLKPMDRRGYEPFDVTPLSRLRRQWLIWRASRDPQRIFAV
ncbi:phytoene/squalene synthase family protein [Undibacter mobilis]|uniref:Phytoene/squalene synthase family protein n=1 Tax=Undibacter mobilis TaxID=2292256 RepID=A0A371B0N0_9BRAD|nr:squalene/phytoene synthase family protein [Undibacter mobilis]RDV01092.1 phytoene/squalene synthase family protein [Undibacter mobilis]